MISPAPLTPAFSRLLAAQLAHVTCLITRYLYYCFSICRKYILHVSDSKFWPHICNFTVCNGYIDDLVFLFLATLFEEEVLEPLLKIYGLEKRRVEE